MKYKDILYGIGLTDKQLRAVSYLIEYAINNDYIKHYGTEGMHWGVRRFQNYDGTLTEEGKIRYGKDITIKKGSPLYRVEEKNRNQLESENPVYVNSTKESRLEYTTIARNFFVQYAKGEDIIEKCFKAKRDIKIPSHKEYLKTIKKVEKILNKEITPRDIAENKDVMNEVFKNLPEKYNAINDYNTSRIDFTGKNSQNGYPVESFGSIILKNGKDYLEKGEEIVDNLIYKSGKTARKEYSSKHPFKSFIGLNPYNNLKYVKVNDEKFLNRSQEYIDYMYKNKYIDENLYEKLKYNRLIGAF